MASVTNQEIADNVYNLISNIPTGVSGVLLSLVNHSIYQVENYTGNDIPTSAVPDAYQPAVTNLTIASVLGQMEAQGLGTKSVTIGELSITKGQTDNSSQSFKNLAMSQLSDLGHNINYYTTWN